MENKNKKAMVEAALFMSGEPIKHSKLAKIAKLSEEKLIEIVSQLKEEYNKEDHGVHIFEVPGGIQVKVKPEYISDVRQLAPHQDLNKGLLRVLALVAYKQPITQSEIVKVIGNRTYEYVKLLEERGFVRTVKTGRTKNLVATKEFAEYFGLENIEDIKAFFSEMIKKAPEDDTDEKDERA